MGFRVGPHIGTDRYEGVLQAFLLLVNVPYNGNYPAFEEGPQEAENGLLRDAGSRSRTTTIPCRFLG